MKQEDKDLLLKDLCARLPYGVKVKFKVNEVIESREEIPYNIDGEYSYITDGKSYLTLDIIKMIFNNYLDDIKPYLFPLSSMTEEQKKEYYALADDVTIKPGKDSYFGIKIHCIKLGISDNPHEGLWDDINLDAINWLLKNNFDIYGLIPKGLAIDATGLNIY
jgi:hypothetical protein